METRHQPLVTRASLVELLYPKNVIAFEAVSDVPPDVLLSAERDCVSHSSPARVREFAAGRFCARAGIVKLGLKPIAIVRGADRAPIWPSGVVGSISHTEGYCVAVVAQESQLASIGVDVERLGRMTSSVRKLTMRTEENDTLHRLDERMKQLASTAIFSAKESFYKCQHALTGEWIDFDQVCVTLGAGAFKLEICDPPQRLAHLRSWAGRFVVRQDVVITAIAATHTDLEQP